jgi:hypothetical protein
VMDNLIDLGVTKMVTIEIMEVDKEGIWTIFVVKNKGIEGMIVHYRSNIFKMIFSTYGLGECCYFGAMYTIIQAFVAT